MVIAVIVIVRYHGTRYHGMVPTRTGTVPGGNSSDRYFTAVFFILLLSYAFELLNILILVVIFHVVFWFFGVILFNDQRNLFTLLFIFIFF